MYDTYGMSYTDTDAETEIRCKLNFCGFCI